MTHANLIAWLRALQFPGGNCHRAADAIEAKACAEFLGEGYEAVENVVRRKVGPDYHGDTAKYYYLSDLDIALARVEALKP